MIKIALCDDEVNVMDAVSSCIHQYAESKNKQDLAIFHYNSARMLMSALDEGSAFDIYILDVYLGEELGTELARAIRKRGIESPIVFLTTSLEHAPESFETATLRYLLKPLDFQKFYEAMDAAIIQARKLGERCIKLKTENGVESINASRILYSESYGHYQYVNLEDGKQLRVRMTVAELLTLLMKNGGFLQVGRAYIVNLRNIRNVSTTQVHLYHDINIPIPRGKHTEIKNAFWDFQCDGQED